MGLADPVLLIYDYDRRGFRLQQGRETAYDPETRELLVFPTADKARAWSVAHWGVDPGALGTEPKPIETLPLFRDPADE